MFTNKKREGINRFVCDVSLYVAETPKASIKYHKPPLPIIPFGIVAYGFVGQPFSKQLYSFRESATSEFFSVASFLHLVFAAAALYERAQIGYYNKSEEIEKAYYVRMIFLCFLFFLIRSTKFRPHPGTSETIVIPSVSRLKMSRGSGEEMKKECGGARKCAEHAEITNSIEHFLDFWNRKTPLCTLFYEIQTC